MADVTEDLRLPNLAQVKELIADIDASDVGAIPFYKYLSEIGLTAGSETIESIVNAMPTYSMLEINCTAGWTNGAIYPQTDGTLTVCKTEALRATVRFVGAGTNYVYEGSCAGAWSGWKRVFYADGSVPMSSHLKMDGNTVVLQPDYNWGSEAWSAIYGIDSGFVVETRNNGLPRQFTLNDPSVDLARSIEIWDGSLNRGFIFFGEHNKPSGEYTGNGSTAQRFIDIGGIGDFVIVRKSGGTPDSIAIVAKSNGALCNSGTTVKALPNEQVAINSQRLELHTTDDSLNTNGAVYKYYVF